MTRIILEPDEVWEYFNKNKKELFTSMHEVASNDEYGVVVYVTEGMGLPNIVVEADGQKIYDEKCLNEKDCENTVQNVFDDYLTSGIVNALASSDYTERESYSDLEMRLEIEERESELEDATFEFINAVCDGDAPTACYCDTEMLKDVEEHFLEYLARKWDIPIRRPMILEDENGKDFFEEYPYEFMDFEDSNPIYDK